MTVTDRERSERAAADAASSAFVAVGLSSLPLRRGEVLCIDEVPKVLALLTITYSEEEMGPQLRLAADSQNRVTKDQFVTWYLGWLFDGEALRRHLLQVEVRVLSFTPTLSSLFRFSPPSNPLITLFTPENAPPLASSREPRGEPSCTDRTAPVRTQGVGARLPEGADGGRRRRTPQAEARRQCTALLLNGQRICSGPSSVGS